MQKGIMLKTVMDEDWKTTIARNQRNLGEGEIVTVLEMIQTGYLLVEADDGIRFYVHPDNIKIIGDEK